MAPSSTLAVMPTAATATSQPTSSHTLAKRLRKPTNHQLSLSKSLVLRATIHIRSTVKPLVLTLSMMIEKRLRPVSGFIVMTKNFFLFSSWGLVLTTKSLATLMPKTSSSIARPALAQSNLSTKLEARHHLRLRLTTPYYSTIDAVHQILKSPFQNSARFGPTNFKHR